MNINLDQALVEVGPIQSFYGTGKFCAVALSSSLLCHLCAAPSFAIAATATYPISNAIVANPERGFHISPDNCERTPWTKAFLDAEKARSGEPTTTLVRCVFYLPATQDQIPNQVALFAHQASAAKEAGLKMILRFAYFKNDGGKDAPLSQVLSHLSQLQTALQTHKDAIAVMESGFVGQWGEGHNSTYFPTNGHLEKPLRVWQNVGASNLT
jgi:hypothetical protein